jgi:hypothetical protein
MPNLADTQKLFWELISAPEGVAEGLAALADRERRLPGGLGGVFVGDERLGADRRLDVYAGMYFFRLEDAIRENAPALAAALGEEAFHHLCVDYLLAHPSEHWSLREVGRRLERYLRSSPSATSTPWAADLAAFEWAFLEAFDAADATPIVQAALAAVEPEAWADLRLRLSPSLRILDLEFAVAETWRPAIHGEPFELPIRRAASVRLWRREHRVHHREIDRVERVGLEAILAGEAFGVVCERVADEVGDEAAAERAFALLSRWVADELLVGAADGPDGDAVRLEHLPRND